MNPAVVVVGDRDEGKKLFELGETPLLAALFGQSLEIIEGQPRRRVLLREQAAGERHVEFGGMARDTAVRW